MSPLVKSDAKVQLLRSIPLFTKCTAAVTCARSPC